MPISTKIVVSGAITFTFDEIDSIQRLRDVIRAGLAALPSAQLFSDDINEFVDELEELLTRYGE